MQSAKSTSTPLRISLRLSQRDCPKGKDMKSVPYASTVGFLMYAMVTTQPDIAHAIGVVSRFTHNPSWQHWNTINHIFKYLVGTKNLGILFFSNKISDVFGYTDSHICELLRQLKVNNRILSLKWPTCLWSRGQLGYIQAITWWPKDYIGAVIHLHLFIGCELDSLFYLYGYILECI